MSHECICTILSADKYLTVNYLFAWFNGYSSGVIYTRCFFNYIHRAPFGSMERFVAVLIEHTAGKFPLWLTPDQAVVLPISEKSNEYAHKVREMLEAQDVRCIVDDRNEKLGRKIRDNELKRIPYMLIVGEKEAELGLVSVRQQGAEEKGQMTVQEFADMITATVKEQMNAY